MVSRVEGHNCDIGGQSAVVLKQGELDNQEYGYSQDTYT